MNLNVLNREADHRNYEAGRLQREEGLDEQDDFFEGELNEHDNCYDHGKLERRNMGCKSVRK